MLTLKAPAKINWFLKIQELRDDGYHEINSLIQKITIYDVLTFSVSDDVTLECHREIPVEENLIYRAAMLLKTAYKVSAGAAISVKKEIPMGAGLGGGSSDAAAALIGLNRLWALKSSTDDLCQLAGRLGSDVPFFLHGPVSYVHGRGEKVSPCSLDKGYTILLVRPPINVSTAWAYREYFKLTKKPEKVNNIEHFIHNIENAELGHVSDIVLNDLEAVTAKEFPVVAEIKDKLRGQGAVFALMSGSGPTVFGVFEAREMAEEASHEFRGFWTAVVETITD